MPSTENLQAVSATRREILDDLTRRVNDRVLEPSNADLLQKLILKAETDDEAISIAALGTTYKRTGFHFDKRLEPLTSDIRYLRRNPDLGFQTDSGALTHRLIIGDNYEALHNLLIQYRGKVDVIYIDPPYGKDSMGEFATTNYENAITRDNLLSMLYARLVLARQLLSDSGVIFCSIDDRNQAYVKCLFDEVFLEKNFAGTIIWQSATDNNPRQISTEHEYILCYCKQLDLQQKWVLESEKARLIEKKYKELKVSNFDPQGIQEDLRKWINKNKEALRGVAHYNNVDEKGVYSNSSNSSNTKPGGYTFDIIHPMTGKPVPKPAFGWRWKEETFWAYEREGNVEWGMDETTQPHIKKRIETAEEQLKSIHYEDGRVATKMLEGILGKKKIFDNPKPVNLLARLIEFTSNKDSLILDFFAGSGTTGHAVLELNRKDGGKRKFILCQLNEKTDTTPHGIVYDVTAPRLRRIMTGADYDGAADFRWAKENKPYGDNLEVTEVARVFNAETTKGQTPFDVIDERLYGQEQFQTLREKVDWVCQNFRSAQRAAEEVKDWEQRKRELDNYAARS